MGKKRIVQSAWIFMNVFILKGKRWLVIFLFSFTLPFSLPQQKYLENNL